jgi:hypothetical protein
MFRHRARPDLPQLDDAIGERLLDGTAGDDVPPSYRRVAELLVTVCGPATPEELQGAARATAAFAATHHAANRPPVRHVRPLAAAAVTAALLAGSTGTAVAATEGALPQAAQAVAHDALGVVGISVPDVQPQHPDPQLQEGSPSNDAPTVGAPRSIEARTLARPSGAGTADSSPPGIPPAGSAPDAPTGVATTVGVGGVATSQPVGPSDPMVGPTVPADAGTPESDEPAPQDTTGRKVPPGQVKQPDVPPGQAKKES